MKSNVFIVGMLGIALALGMMFVGCEGGLSLKSCSNQSECNDDDYVYCGTSSCESSEYYTVGGQNYYDPCDGVCDGK